MDHHWKVPKTIPPGPLLALMGVLAVAKRFGLAKPVFGFALGQMGSPQAYAGAFGDYRANGSDVFAATFAKSGTNWLMQIAQQIAYYGDGEYDHIHELVPWPDAPFPVGPSLDDARQRHASPTGLRVVKTHLPAEFIPYSPEATYLSILRDPKEVVVSGYYFLGGLVGALPDVTIADWLDLAHTPGGFLDGWAAHTAGFWAWRERPNVFVRGYGEMLADPGAAVDDIASVMGVTLDDRQRARVLERSSFAYMKEHDAQFRPPPRPFAGAGSAPEMVRRGKSGGSDEALTGEQRAAVDRFCRSRLAALGSDFPYDETF